MTGDIAALDPLITEAAKKAAICWISVGDTPHRALWCSWLDDALCVVCGPGEQSDPGLSDTEQCAVTLRGDHNGRIVTFAADVMPVTPDSPDWETVATPLAGKRLNAVGDTVGRWAAACGVYRLVPRAEAARSGRRLPDDSLAAPVVPSPAARPTRQPFRLHKVKGKRQKNR